MLRINRKVFPCLYILLVSAIVVACGGGGGTLAGGGIGGTGITSGTVTGFGSVYVNGVEYFMENTTLDIDDDFYQESVSEDNFNLEDVLDVNMVVTVVWEENPDGTYTATSVAFDEEVEGPVATGSLTIEDLDTRTRSFMVLGVEVIVARESTSFVGWPGDGFELVSEGDVVEVSGFYDANGILRATRVEKEDDLQLNAEIEVKGVVEGYTSGDAEFGLGDITIIIGGADLPQGFGNGETVEVHGVVENAAPVTIVATEIEIEDGGYGDTGDATVSLEGIVTAFSSISSFEVNGQLVDATGAVFEPASLESTLGVDDRVDVEGMIDNGVLLASAVEGRGDEVVINAIVAETSVIDGLIMLEVVAGEPVVTVRESVDTEYEDERDGFSLSGIAELVPGDYLQLEAIIDGYGELVANEVVRDEPDNIELQGPADIPGTAGDHISGELVVLGVTVQTDSETEFENEHDDDISGSEFYAQVQNGDLVRFSDEWPADGVAEKVQFEN